MKNSDVVNSTTLRSFKDDLLKFDDNITKFGEIKILNFIKCAFHIEI